jgi:signal transduction histidine kinase
MASGTNVGVGLAGIRERVNEFGGTLEIHSNTSGTTLRAAVPIADRINNAFAATSISQIYSSLAS